MNRQLPLPRVSCSSCGHIWVPRVEAPQNVPDAAGDSTRRLPNEHRRFREKARAVQKHGRGKKKNQIGQSTFSEVKTCGGGALAE